MKTHMLWAAILAALIAVGGDLSARRFDENPWHKAIHAKQQEVSGNVGGLAWGAPNIAYEAALKNGQSWLVGADAGFAGYSGWSYSAVGVHGSYRWWWLENRPLQGIYAGPRAGVVSYSWTYDYAYVDGVTPTSGRETVAAAGIGIGGEGGYQWIFNNGLLLRAGGVVDYVIGSVSTRPGSPTLYGFGLRPGAEAAVGYAW